MEVWSKPRNKRELPAAIWISISQESPELGTCPSPHGSHFFARMSLSWGAREEFVPRYGFRSK